MVKRVTERQLVQLVRELAKATRLEIESTKLALTDFGAIAKRYNIILAWEKLPIDKPGSYSKDDCKIILNNHITSQERLNFTFFHEFMHHLIEHNDEILSLLADAYILSDYETIERLCNAGAAEILIPSDNLRQAIIEHEFSTLLIPSLSTLYSASSIAVALQMINCALHDAYLLIAENRQCLKTIDQPSFFPTNIEQVWRLQVIYSGHSPSAKYNLGCNIYVNSGHLMYDTLDFAGKSLKGRDDIPRKNSLQRHWIVDCEALYFRGKVFAFFNVSPPISNQQLKLW